MKKFKGALWGLALIAIGVIFALNALNITDINIFFEGWWTLFIIVPCFISLFGKGDKTGDVIGILIGIGLLLASHDVFSFGTFWKLCIPIIIVVIGFRLVFRNLFKKDTGDRESTFHVNVDCSDEENSASTDRKEYCAAFSGINADFAGQVFEGADLTAVFGGVDCRLENAIIEKDVVVNATAVFGGVDIKVPAGVNVKVSSVNIFGGTSDKRRASHIENAPTVYVNSTSVFGGVDIK